MCLLFKMSGSQIHQPLQARFSCCTVLIYSFLKVKTEKSEIKKIIYFISELLERRSMSYCLRSLCKLENLEVQINFQLNVFC